MLCTIIVERRKENIVGFNSCNNTLEIIEHTTPNAYDVFQDFVHRNTHGKALRQTPAHLKTAA